MPWSSVVQYACWGPTLLARGAWAMSRSRNATRELKGGQTQSFPASGSLPLRSRSATKMSSDCCLAAGFRPLRLQAAIEFDHVPVRIRGVERSLTPTPVAGWPGGLYPVCLHPCVQLIDAVRSRRNLNVEARSPSPSNRVESSPNRPWPIWIKAKFPGRCRTSTAPGMRM